MGEGVVLVQFARAPEAGAVKTRLIPALGAEGAAKLHSALVRHTCRTLLEAGLGPVQLWVAGDVDNPLIAECAAMGLEAVCPQSGEDLGERMGNALIALLERASRVILVGSDIPGLDGAYLKAAAEALQSKDVVLGPALDGGYGLIGVRRFDWRLMDSIPWGTDRVLAQTEQRLEELDWSWCCLKPLADIDRPEDLAQLPPELAVSA